jgi:hypothetical protein
MTYTKKPYEQLTKEEKELVAVAKAYGFRHTQTFDTENELGLLVTTPENPYSDGLYKLFKNQTGNMVNFPVKVITPQTKSSADSVTFAISEIERCLLGFDPGLETADYIEIFTRLLDQWFFKDDDQEPFKTLYMGQFLTEMAKMYNETNKSELFVNQDPYILKHAIDTKAIPNETLKTISDLADKKMTFSHATDFDSLSSENVLN